MASKQSTFDKKDKAIGVSYVAAAHPGVRDQWNLATRRHQWVRQNGEIVPIRGFKNKDIETMRPAFNQLNSRLKDDVKLGIRYNKQRTQPGTRAIVAAQYVPKAKVAEDLMTETLQKHGQSASQAERTSKRVATIMKATRMTKNDSASIRIQPKYFRGGGLINRFSSGKVNPRGLLIHETGHAVDFSNGKSFDKRRSAGEAYRGNGGMFHISLNGQHPPAYNQHTPEKTKGTVDKILGLRIPRKAYGDTSQLEHFAESFRSQFKEPFFTGKLSDRQKVHGATSKAPVIKQYFNKNVLHSPHPDAAVIQKVDSIYGHGNKFLAAAAVSTGAYEATKHSQEAKKAWKTRRQLYGKAGRKVREWR